MKRSGFLRGYSNYQLAVLLSAMSLGLGLIRELIIVGLLGFTLKNDALQIYLSVIYTISLMVDAMRLSCLNLVSVLSLGRMLFSASVISLPAAVLAGCLMSFFTRGMDWFLLWIAMLGGYCHLMACLLITYRQRRNVFLAAQVINVLPNAFLIPGVVICYFFSQEHMVSAMVILTSLVPLVQCILLLFLPDRSPEGEVRDYLPFADSLLVFLRHFSTTLGEQLYQIVIRSALFNYGPGYLSVFSLSVRSVSALRFILIDSWIGSKLSEWQRELKGNDFRHAAILRGSPANFLLAAAMLVFALTTETSLLQYALQMAILLTTGFWFSTLVRVIYFRLNHLENNTRLVMTFAVYELAFALLSWVFARQVSHAILLLVWTGYIARPVSQLLFLRRRVNELAVAC